MLILPIFDQSFHLAHNRDNILLSYFYRKLVFKTLFLVMCCSNGLLLIAILLITSLRKRKEMLVIAGMATCDLIYGIGTVLNGAYRLIIFFCGLQNVPLSAWDCLWQSPYSFIFTGSFLSPIMGIVISVDRFIAVGWPIKYRSLGLTYVRGILFIMLMITALIFISLLASTYFYVGPVIPNTRICSYPHPRWYGHYSYLLVPILGWFSVIVYVGVFLKFRQSSKAIVPRISRDQAANVQRRLTITLGMLTASTLTFFAIPWTYISSYIWMDKVVPYQFIIASYTRICPIVHVLIFFYRQREIRFGMRRILCRNYQTILTSGVGRMGLSRGTSEPVPSLTRPEIR